MLPILALSFCIHACYIGSKMVVSLYALAFGANQALVGVIAMLYALVPLLLGVHTGRVADTIGVRVLMFAGSACIVVAMVAGCFATGLIALCVTATLVGTGFVLFNVCVQNLTGALGSPADRARNFSWLSIGYSVSTFSAPMICGFTIDHAGHAAAFAVLGVLAALPTLLLAVTGRYTRTATATANQEQRNAFDLLRMPALRRLIVMSGLMVAASDLFAFYVPVFTHSIGLSASTTGLVLGAYAVAVFVTRFAMPFLVSRWTSGEILFVAMGMSALSFVVFPLFGSLYPLMALAFIIGLGLGCGQPLSMTLCYERSPPGRTGEATGLRLTANNIARVVVPLVSGALGAALGTAPVFWLSAINLFAVSGFARR